MKKYQSFGVPLTPAIAVVEPAEDESPQCPECQWSYPPTFAEQISTIVGFHNQERARSLAEILGILIIRCPDCTTNFGVSATGSYIMCIVRDGKFVWPEEEQFAS